MRYILAWIVGLLTTGVTLRMLEYEGEAIGVYRYVDLPYPMRYAVGRYIDEIIDEDFTAFGIASLTFSLAVGVVVGAAVYRKNFYPAESIQERLTATAWFAALGPILVITALGQVIFGTHASDIHAFLKDALEYGGALYIGWISWKWWKRKTAAARSDLITHQ